MAFSNAVNKLMLGTLAKPIGFAGGALAFVSGVAAGFTSSPHIQAYAWDGEGGGGWGSKYSNPATAVGGSVFGVRYVNAGDDLLCAVSLTSGFVAYAWTKAGGFGTKYAAPSTPANGTRTDLDAREASADAFVQVVGSSADLGFSNWLQGYNFGKDGSGWGSKLADPSPKPTDRRNSVAFRRTTQDAIVCGGRTSPYADAYAFSSSGFGSRFANPASLPPNIINRCDFTGTGGAVMASHNQSGSGAMCSAWAFTSSGWGSLFSDPAAPAGLTPNTGWAMRSANNGLGGVVGLDFNGTTRMVQGWQFADATGWGARYSTITPIVSGRGSDADFDPADEFIFISTYPSPRMQAYVFDANSGFGAKSSNMSPLPTTGNYESIGVSTAA